MSRYSAPSSFSRDPSAKGLVGLWSPLLGPQGGILYDLSGYANHGTLTNMEIATDWIPSMDGGYALTLGGVDEYVNIPDANQLDLTTEMTAAIWARVNANAIRYDLFSKMASATPGWVLQRESDNRIYLGSMAAGGGYQGTTATTYTEITQVHHWCATYNAGTIVLYYDGVSQALGAPTTVPATLPVNAMPLRIGANNNPSDYLVGDVVEARLYNRALSASEVWRLYRPETRWDLYRPRPHPAALAAAAGMNLIPTLVAHQRRRVA